MLVSSLDEFYFDKINGLEPRSFKDYELGRLYSCMGDKAKARNHLELVSSGKNCPCVNSSHVNFHSGKPLERDPNTRKVCVFLPLSIRTRIECEIHKGKYSMQASSGCYSY